MPVCHTFKCLHYSCLRCFSLGIVCIIVHVWIWNSIWMFLCVGACVCICVWIYAWVCESRTTIQSPGIRVLMPIFQLLYCKLNPVNLLLFTLSCSSYSLCLYLSLSHTLMLIYSPSVSLLLSLSISLQLPAVHLPFSRTQRSLVFSVFSLSQTFHPLSLYNCASVYLPLQIKPYSDSDRQYLTL